MSEVVSINKRSMQSASPLMQACVQEACLMAATDIPVLIVGPTGAGKENFARLIHEESKRAKGPFVAICAPTVSSGLAESEFFGHEKGSFTGATHQHKGVFEEAGGGTLFIDEITEMSMDLQAKLLRALQEKEIRRVGATKTIAIDVRIVSTTNRDPMEAIQEGKLRADLYYRLQGVVIKLPALAERQEDIALLTKEFIEGTAKLYGLAVNDIAPDALNVLMRHEWPGNVRELQNAISAAVIRAHTAGQTIIKPDHLSPSILFTHQAIGATQPVKPIKEPIEDQSLFDSLIVELKDMQSVSTTANKDALSATDKILSTFFGYTKKRMIADEIHKTVKQHPISDLYIPTPSSIAVTLSNCRPITKSIEAVLANHLEFALGATPETLKKFRESVSLQRLMAAPPRSNKWRTKEQKSASLV